MGRLTSLYRYERELIAPLPNSLRSVLGDDSLSHLDCIIRSICACGGGRESGFVSIVLDLSLSLSVTVITPIVTVTSVRGAYISAMSRSDLANHPAVSFTVKRPPPVSQGTSESSSTSSFKVPAEAKRSGASGVAAPSPLAISSNGNGKRRQTQNHHDDDSSDDDAGTEDEIITGFDSLGVQRCVQFSLSPPEERMLKTYTQPHMSHILVRKSGQLKAHLSFLLSPIETGELRPADARVPQFSSQTLVELPLVSARMEVLAG